MPKGKSQGTISIVGIPDAALIQKQFRQFGPEVKEIPIEDLADNFYEFIKKFNIVLNKIPDNLNGYKVDTLSLTVGVSVDGTIKILGIGGDVGAEASITINFKKGNE